VKGECRGAECPPDGASTLPGTPARVAPPWCPVYHPPVRPLLVPLLAALVLAAPHASAQDDDGWSDEDEHDERGRLSLTAWGGQAYDTGGNGRNVPLLGGEAAWAFGSLDVGLAGYAYDGIHEESTGRDPVLLLRLTQRFETRRGLEAAFTFGGGTARRREDWVPWFQLALGVRLNLGPAFLAGELGFEQHDLLRLAAGIGVRLF
jgi:hypothetical protein